MHIALAAAEATKEFNADFYLAIVTILPILMLATGLLADFAKFIPLKTQESWRPSFYSLVSFLYLGSPVIAAIGIGTGVLALMYRDGNAAYQWITFICFIIVVTFLAIVSVFYLNASDPGKHAQAALIYKVFKVLKEFKRRKAGQAGATSEPTETPAGTGEVGGSTTQV